MRHLSSILLSLLMLSGCSSSSTSEESNPRQLDDRDNSGIINDSNVDLVAQQVISAINLVGLEKERLNTRSFRAQLFDDRDSLVEGGESLMGLVLASEVFVEDDASTRQIIRTTLSCANNGSVELDKFDYGDAPYYESVVRFSNCGVHERIYNGEFGESGGRRSTSINTYNNYSFQSTENSVSITGKWSSGYGSYAGEERIIWEDAAYTVTTADATMAIGNLNWDRVGLRSYYPSLRYGANLSASFSLLSDWTNGEKAEVSLVIASPQGWIREAINSVYLPDDDAEQEPQATGSGTVTQWEGGEIEVIAVDGSTLSMQPNQDVPEQLLLELNNSGETLGREWSDGYQIYCPYIFNDCAVSD